MINNLFRIKGLFGFKVNIRIEIYVDGSIGSKDLLEMKDVFIKHYKTDNVIVIAGFGKEGIYITYY